MKKTTQNFYDNELKAMAKNPSKKAMEIGKRPPYYLEAIKREKMQKEGAKNGKAE